MHARDIFNIWNERGGLYNPYAMFEFWMVAKESIAVFVCIPFAITFIWIWYFLLQPTRIAHNRFFPT